MKKVMIACAAVMMTLAVSAKTDPVKNNTKSTTPAATPAKEAPATVTPAAHEKGKKTAHIEHHDASKAPQKSESKSK